ncbi:MULTISPECIES: WXG100 family type VII secretion target [unclassified Streptomyces]|uniref:WXG100 family type VII secretion target n=1 Tax=unclassified Streptomyces TaxID=2593676 RepID=UPI00278BD728|nr:MULTISPECIES: WXG100 family type VII secretion target [unclassified Streptomyces]
MSDGEGVAEQVHELGVEIMNPGGDPDALRAAAQGWRTMSGHLEEAFSALDKQVEKTLNAHWRGDSADAFKAYWDDLKVAVDDTLPTFEKAAAGLEDAAKSIEEINDEIKEIYLEIGVSIAAGAALSFVTLGFGTAASAANATRLAAEAANAATKLGRILSAVAKAFRAIRMWARSAKWKALVVELGTQYAGGYASGVATSVATGNGGEWGKNAVNAGYGALGGAAAGAALGGRLGGGLAEGVASGAAGGAAGNVAGSATEDLAEGGGVDGTGLALDAVLGGVGGAAGGAATHHLLGSGNVDKPTELATDVGANFAAGTGAGIEGDEVTSARDDAVEEDKVDAKKVRVRDEPDTSKFGAFG